MRTLRTPTPREVEIRVCRLFHARKTPGSGKRGEGDGTLNGLPLSIKFTTGERIYFPAHEARLTVGGGRWYVAMVFGNEVYLYAASICPGGKFRPFSVGYPPGARIERGDVVLEIVKTETL